MSWWRRFGSAALVVALTFAAFLASAQTAKTPSSPPATIAPATVAPATVPAATTPATTAPASTAPASPSPTAPTSGGRTGGTRDWLPVAIAAGAVALAAISNSMAKEKGPEGQSPEAPDSGTEPPEPDLVSSLAQSGPLFATTFNMSAFNVRGLVRGGWPIILDYELGTPSLVELTLSARGLSEVYTYDLSRFGIGRRSIQFRIPAELFGDQVRPALIAVTATDVERRQTVPDFRVHALGIGPRAIGSVAIDRVEFRPPSIRVLRQEQAAYRFFSHSNFSNLSAEFVKVENSADGIHHYFVHNQFLGGARKDQWVGDPERRGWDGRDKAKRVSSGPHKLQVRAWDQQGDWIAAWSYSLVKVSQ